MKKKVWSLFLVVAVAFSMVACGSSNSSAEEKEEEIEYVSADDISNVLADPDNYVGKYIVITGQVFNKINSDDEQQTIQVYYDAKNYSDDYIVYCSADDNISEDEYIEVDGKILGAESFETFLGEQRDMLSIDASTVTEKNYIDIVVPAIATVTPEDATVTQNDITVTVDKVEFAESETRIWITMQNDSSESVDIYPAQAILVQNGKQYEYNWDSDTIYETDEEEPSDRLLSGLTSSGLIVFPAIDSSEESQLYIDNCNSDDYEIEFEPFIITIPAAD